MNDGMKKAGMVVSNRPPNIFHGKVPGPELEKYLKTHKKQEAIIPDLMIHDY